MRAFTALIVLAFLACDSDAPERDTDASDTAAETLEETVSETIDDTVEETTDAVEETVAETIDDAVEETSDAVADDLVLDFRYGNQITGSTLTITPAGVTEATERTCCPPSTTPSEVADLDPTQRATLEADIAAIVLANATDDTDLGEFAAGASVGELVVISGGVRYVVRAYENRDDRRVRTSSTATDAVTSLLALVSSLVAVDME